MYDVVDAFLRYRNSTYIKYMQYLVIQKLNTHIYIDLIVL
jgi:hypothetical protein